MFIAVIIVDLSAQGIVNDTFVNSKLLLRDDYGELFAEKGTVHTGHIVDGYASGFTGYTCTGSFTRVNPFVYNSNMVPIL